MKGHDNSLTVGNLTTLRLCVKMKRVVKYAVAFNLYMSDIQCCANYSSPCLASTQKYLGVYIEKIKVW